MFSPPVYLSIGDEYDKHPPLPNHGVDTKKKPFVVSHKRNPHVEDATFSPYVSLSTGDPYRSVGFDGPFRQGGASEAKVKVEQPPFRPPGVSHKSTGKGDYYGTFSERDPPKHETELPFFRQVPKECSKRKFYTNPPQKGTYGYAGLTIGRAGEVQYVSDPYEGNRRHAALEQKAANMKCMGSRFCSAVRKCDFFDETEHGFSQVYNLTKPLMPKKQLPQLQPVIAKPWVPAGALSKNINTLAEYQEDPYDVKEQHRRQMQQKEHEYKPWYPIGNDPYRHIYTKPISYDPPAL